MANADFDHLLAIKRVISYIAGSLDVGLCYGKKHASLDLCGYANADFAGDKDSKKSSFMFTLVGNCIQWKSVLQSMVTFSTTKSEYIAISEAVKECVWLMGIAKEARIIDKLGTIYTCYNERMKRITK